MEGVIARVGVSANERCDVWEWTVDAEAFVVVDARRRLPRRRMDRMRTSSSSEVGSGG